MKVSWLDAMKGIVQWVAAGTGLPNASIAWSGQGGNWPAAPWISLNMPNTRGVGSDWLRHEHNPLVIPDDVVEAVSLSANTLTMTAHGLLTGDGPVRFVTTGVLPAGIALSTDYWIVVVTANTVRLATSRAAAIAAVPVVVDITGGGSGVHTLQDTPDTRRVGQEVRHRAQGMRRAVLTLQCFAEEAVGPVRAQGILEKLRASLVLPAQQARLHAIGFAVATFGEVRVVGGSQSTASDFEPRAVVEVVLNYYDSTEFELGTSIEEVEIAATVKDQAGTEVDSFVFTVKVE